MKYFLITSIILGVQLTSAQEPPPMDPPPRHEGQPGGRGSHLTPAERDRFEAAKKKALEDPKIAELRSAAESKNREFFRAMKDKMLEIDPSLADILKKKMERAKKWHRRNGMEKPHGPAALSETERQRLMAARQSALATPEVQAAAKKREEAKTPDERKAAAGEFGSAMHDAMLKADPSLKEILDKMRPPKPPGPTE